MTIIADTGPVFALIDASDSWHARVKTWWRKNGDRVVIPVTVLPEVTYLLQTRISAAAEEAFVRALADGELVVEPFDDADLPRIAEIMHAYRNFPLGFVDASIVALAERLDTPDVLTVDRRHFGALRPKHVRALTLFP